MERAKIRAYIHLSIWCRKSKWVKWSVGLKWQWKSQAATTDEFSTLMDSTNHHLWIRIDGLYDLFSLSNKEKATYIKYVAHTHTIRVRYFLPHEMSVSAAQVLIFRNFQLLLLLLPFIRGHQADVFKHPHRTFGSVLRRMPFLMQLTDSRET